MVFLLFADVRHLMISAKPSSTPTASSSSTTITIKNLQQNPLLRRSFEKPHKNGRPKIFLSTSPTALPLLILTTATLIYCCALLHAQDLTAGGGYGGLQNPEDQPKRHRCPDPWQFACENGVECIAQVM